MTNNNRLGGLDMRAWTLTFSIAVFVAIASADAMSGPTGVERQPAGRMVEIRSYNLKPGTRDRFHQLFVTEALPMLRRWKVEVVAYGPSLHDKDSYFLMRAFAGIDERLKAEDAFYGSEEWVKGPRERVLADIDSYTTIVVHLDELTVQGLRQGVRPSGGARAGEAGVKPMANDLDLLTKLNDDYIQSVQHSNVQRFDEILSDDFMCSNPDGTLIDRRAFLQQTARPATIKNLTAHDVNVRIMGDFAIIHARTSYTAADGSESGGRYTDVWARRNGKWLAVSAHVTRK
jgi:ketosteroid isomerase-like protein